MLMAAAAAGGAAVVAATIQAIRASGVIVHVGGEEFLSIVNREPNMLVVHATGGLITTNYQYLTSYRGLAFYTKTSVPLPLPKGLELVQASQIGGP